MAVWLAPRSSAVGPLAVGAIASASASALIVGSHLGDAGTGRLLLATACVLIPCALAGRPTSGAYRGRWVGAVACAAIAATALTAAVDRGSGCQGDASHGRIGIWHAAVATAAERPLQGFGSGTFLQASRAHQLARRPRTTRFAHNLALEAWVELGVVGLALIVALYASVLVVVIRSPPLNPEAYLLAPFALANLLDWPWHLLGAGVLWAVTVGGVSLYLTTPSAAARRSGLERV